MTETLDKGIALAKAGEKAQALEYLKRAIQQEPRNPTAWLWLAGVLDDPQKQRQCLQQVLLIDPSNQAARRGLEKMDAPQTTPPPAAVPTPAFTDPFKSTSETKPSPFVMDQGAPTSGDANWVSPFEAFSQGKLDKALIAKQEQAMQSGKGETASSKKPKVVLPPKEPAPSMPGKPYFLAMGTMLAIPM
ncbi:MAG TPA: tetratricopeptide repeat protein, partial [Longilinea sp.]|nr:tetratricopeptide repeat protein [Longilinea sp.]